MEQCLAPGASRSGHKQSSYVAKVRHVVLEGFRPAVVATGRRLLDCLPPDRLMPGASKRRLKDAGMPSLPTGRGELKLRSF